LQRLAALARVDPITLANLASGAPVAAAGPTIWFCCRCFFLNPLEVESPYWHAAWLAIEPSRCPVHNVAPEWLPTSVLAKARNIARLLDYVGSHRTTLFSWEVATRGPRWRR